MEEEAAVLIDLEGFHADAFLDGVIRLLMTLKEQEDIVGHVILSNIALDGAYVDLQRPA